jgi:hypothetical protein
MSISWRHLRIIVTVALTAVAVTGPAAPSSAGGSWKRCGNAYSAPDEPGFNIRSRNLSCGKARRYTRACVRNGNVCPLPGYRCRKRRTVDALYRVTCVKGGRAFSYGGGS